MNNNNLIIIELLSAGVIAALVTGFFSLFIAVKNNKRLLDLENRKQKFTVNQERFKALRDAYGELISILPEEKLVGHIIMNLPSKKDFAKNGLSEIYEIAEQNIKIIFSHFQKHCYLFTDDEQKKVENAVEEIDIITKKIINFYSYVDIYSIDEDEDEDEYKEKSEKECHINSSDSIREKITERIMKITKLEDMYYNLFKKNLSELSM